jgi:hypothetical protein
MANNKLSHLRNHLFETLEALKDEDKPMDVKRGVAISMVAQQIIESAKVQLKYEQFTEEVEISTFFDKDKAIEASSVLKGLGRS